MFRMTKLTDKNRDDVVDIFNYYVRNGFSSFFDQEIDNSFFDRFMQTIGEYPALAVMNTEDKTVGYSFVRPYHISPVFKKTGEISYFIAPDHTSKGLGTALLDNMVQRTQNFGIDTLLAFVAEKNLQSIRFHEKNGFEQCARFLKIGRKLKDDITVIGYQKFI